MPRCPDCEQAYDDALRRCPHCAEPERADAATVKCAACGAQVAEGEDACADCGTLRVTDVACETHPDREAEDRCVMCGRALCARCRSGDEYALCEEHRTVPVIEGWAQVYSTTGEFEARLLRENLLAEGLDAQVYSQRDSAFSLDIGELSIVRVLVPVRQFGPALRLIRGHMDAEGEIGFACPECGEAYADGERECASCGTALA